MAVRMDSPEIFSNLSSKIGQLLFGRTEGDRNIISKTLDDLNSLNYRYTVVTSPTKAVLLINQCCSFIPTDDKFLVQKCSQLLTNLVNRQNVTVEGRTLTVSVQWCLQGLKIKDKTVVLDILHALDALLRCDIHYINLLIDGVIKELKLLITTEKDTPEIIVLAVQCLEACTVVPNDHKSRNDEELLPHFDVCGEIFTTYLCNRQSMDELMYSMILKTCLTGLQNIIIQYPKYLQKELQIILGIIKTYMLYGIKGVDYITPQKLLPSTLSVPEVPNNSLREKKGGKLTKQRKHRTSGVSSKKDSKSNEEVLFKNRTNSYTPATTSLDYNSDNGAGKGTSLGNKLKTSDSDFSDNEGGRLSKLHQSNGRVRQAALGLFYNVVKHTDKITVFSYWTSFIPEGSLSGKHNLITCILKDPSARSRMAALNVLLLLLTTSKLYLSQAETSDKSTSFTPFSVVLGLMLFELHKGLSLALNEMSVPVLTQILKCFAALVQATPYHRMSHGLVTKIVRNVKCLIYHKDASVQVTALIVIGCLLASEPVVPETKQAMIRLQKDDDNTKISEKTGKIKNENFDSENFDFAEFSSDEDELDVNVQCSSIPWLLKRCLSNLGVNFKEPSVTSDGTNDRTVPAPVKLESLQVLSAMSRNYFELMAPYLAYIIKGLDVSLFDKYTDLRLHAGRAVDFIGQAINKFISNEEVKSVLSLDQCLLFWQTLLKGSLINLLQCEQHSILRAVGCDCLGSIGPQIFEQLPRDKQILCITLLFSCTRDEENCVKGAAVRALAICVLYPSLREDPGFVIDTAETIYRTLRDENLMVRVKASWSLGNLSDALVLNSKLIENEEELPETLLSKLLYASIASSNDNDKIKMNAVRAIGNLLQLIDEELYAKDEFKNATEEALSALVKNCTTGSNMKVRWNACYALGNALKNSALYGECNSNSQLRWQASVFNSLLDLVINFRNFKVRINAAVALSSPPNRENYGQFFLSVWTALLKALENSQNMEDFSEYKHRDHLVDQLCLALGHLTNLLKKEDLILLEDIIYLYLDIFKNHMHKVLERLVPEKSTELFSASCSLNNLEMLPGLNTQQKNVIKFLKDVFVIDF